VSTVYLTDEKYKRLPYKNTSISRAKTYGDIIGLLESHGIKDYRWTRLNDTDILEFPIRIIRDDVEQTLAVRLTVPKLYYLKRIGRSRNSPKKQVYLENVSWRIFWWHLKSKLEAIEYGVSDEVQEFMYHITYALPSGEQVSLGEILMENVANLNKLAALPTVTEEALA